MASPSKGKRLRGPWSGDRLWGAPAPLFVVLVGVEAAAACLAVLALGSEDGSLRSWGKAALLVAMSVAFEEVSRQVGRMRLLISTGPKPDMTSVWTFAAPIVLQPGQAAVVAMAITGHIWLARQRAAGQHGYRKLYSAATIVLACLASSEVLHNGLLSLGYLPAPARFAVTLLVALLIYTGVNRLLISLVVVLSGAPFSGRSIVGSWDDNALEIATLCLGFFAALATVGQPWLLPLILPPTLLLQRGALVKELELAASTDTKTQLLTALAWQQIADRALRQAVREDKPVAVLLIDLDHFKNLNDTWGHLAGDAALLAVSDCLRRELRKSDVVGRFGGEEFVIMLPGHGPEASLVVAERLRSRIGSIELREIGVLDAETAGERPLAASLGLAHSPDHGVELPELLHAADAALYTAKRAGRNRVAVAGEPGAGEDLPAQA
jgi:diguanylate cyclase (GGDEF)-like protein